MLASSVKASAYGPTSGHRLPRPATRPRPDATPHASARSRRPGRHGVRVGQGTLAAPEYWRRPQPRGHMPATSDGHPGANRNPTSKDGRTAACARILRTGLRCINIQAGRLYVEPTAVLLGRGHREDASDNRAPTPPDSGLRSGPPTAHAYAALPPLPARSADLSGPSAIRPPYWCPVAGVPGHPRLGGSPMKRFTHIARRITAVAAVVGAFMLAPAIARASAGSPARPYAMPSRPCARLPVLLSGWTPPATGQQAPPSTSCTSPTFPGTPAR